MANYIKVRPEVARYLHLDTERPMTADGNYVLWIADLSRLGPMRDRDRLVTAAGGVWLTDHQLRDEQRGKLSVSLPPITDERIPWTPEPEEAPEPEESEPDSHDESADESAPEEAEPGVVEESEPETETNPEPEEESDDDPEPEEGGEA